MVEAISRLLMEQRPGIFNLTADGTIKLSEAAAPRRPEDPVPLDPPVPPDHRRQPGRCTCPTSRRRRAQIDFMLYPWIASNEKIKAELGLEAALHEPRDVRDHDAREGHPRGRCGDDAGPVATRGAGRLSPG